MIDKENQMVSVSLKEYEELLGYKWVITHSVSNPQDLVTSIYNIMKDRIKLSTYDRCIEERRYNDSEKILKEIIELFRYTVPEVYENLIEYAKKNKEMDKKNGEDDD